MDENFRRILACVLAYFRENPAPFYHKLKHTGYLRHLLVRKAKKTGEILIDLVTTSQTESLGARMEQKAAEDCDALTGEAVSYTHLDVYKRQM